MTTTPRDTIHTKAAVLARRRSGVLTRAELLQGASSSTITRWIDDGLLVPMHKGVYRHAAVPPSPVGRIVAAVVASGSGACADGRSAAWLHDLWRRPAPTPVEVLLPRQTRAQIVGARLRGASLHRGDVTELAGIQVVSIERCLAELGMWTAPRFVEDAVVLAVRRSQTSLNELAAVAERLQGRRGVATLRRILDEIDPKLTMTRSGLEVTWARSLLASAALPVAPEFNHPIVDAHGRRRLIDVAFVPARFGLELDSDQFHTLPTQFAHDSTRDAAITAIGWRIDHVRGPALREPEMMIPRIAKIVAERLAEFRGA